MEENEIFDTSIAIGRKTGKITIFSAIEHTPSLKRLEVIFPEDEDYTKAIEISEKLRAIGKPIGAIDMLIAAMCLNRNSKLITKDKDYKYIKEIFPEFNIQLLS